jgi:hypothetical protein
MRPVGKKSALPAPAPDQPVHGPVRLAQHRASGAEPSRAGPVPGNRLTPGLDTGDPGTAPALNQKHVQIGFSVESRRPHRAARSRRGFHRGMAHSPAPSNENLILVFCFKNVILPTNFVEVFRLI